jgi:hypothetical protein
MSDLFKNIINKDVERGTLPLSKPYYYMNDISLEEIVFANTLREENYEIIKNEISNYSTSYCGKVKNENYEVFYKYGHNGPSHAHPDKMTVEVVFNGVSLSRDLSNSGYGNALCNEWHRVSASHNTVVVNGLNHVSVDKGELIKSSVNAFHVKANDVYEGIHFERSMTLNNKSMIDSFSVKATDGDVCDYFFHIEGDIDHNLTLVDALLGYNENGYQHISDVKRLETNEEFVFINWNVMGEVITSKINVLGKELFLAKTPDNPVTKDRHTIILRDKTGQPTFDVAWEVR